MEELGRDGVPALEQDAASAHQEAAGRHGPAFAKAGTAREEVTAPESEAKLSVSPCAVAHGSRESAPANKVGQPDPATDASSATQDGSGTSESPEEASKRAKNV